MLSFVFLSTAAVPSRTKLLHSRAYFDGLDLADQCRGNLGPKLKREFRGSRVVPRQLLRSPARGKQRSSPNNDGQQCRYIKRCEPFWDRHKRLRWHPDGCQEQQRRVM